MQADEFAVPERYYSPPTDAYHHIVTLHTKIALDSLPLHLLCLSSLFSLHPLLSQPCFSFPFWPILDTMSPSSTLSVLLNVCS